MYDDMKRLEHDRQREKRDAEVLILPSHSPTLSFLSYLAPRRGMRWASNEVREAKRSTTSSTLLLLLSLVSIIDVDDEDEEEEEEKEEAEAEVEATRRAKGRRSVAFPPTCPAKH